MVANVIAALLTTMLVELNDPVSRYVIEWGIFCGQITSSGHVYLHRHIASSMASDGRRRRFWVRTFRVWSLLAKGMTLNWCQRQKWKLDIPQMVILITNFRRSVIIAELWRPEVARPGKATQFCVFFKNDPLRENFQSSVPKGFMAKSMACYVQISWNLAYGKLVKSCVAYLTKTKKIISLGSLSLLHGLRPKSTGPAADNVLRVLRFHPNRFTFGRVISERVNTVRARSKVNAIFGWSLASSRINIIKTKLESVSLTYKSHRIKTANVKFLSANPKHRS